MKKTVQKLSDLCGAIGGITLVAMMALIVVEVTLRSLFKYPIQGTIELVQMMLIIVLFSGMAYVSIRNQHIRVDILINKFTPRAKLATLFSADLVSIGIIIIIVWQSVVQASFLKSTGYMTGMLKLPQWPFALITAVFTAVFVLAVVSNIIETVKDLVSHGKRGIVYMIPGVIIVVVLYLTALWPEMLPIDVSFEMFGIICLLLLGALIFLGVHLGAAMAAIAVWGMTHMAGQDAGLSLIGMTTQSVASNYVWSVGPLFILMGMMVAEAGLSRDIYNTTYKWMGSSPGGLATATVSACGAFAAVVGDSLVGVVTMGTIGIPQMRSYKYDIKLATGAVCAGGTIGILIPPSLGFIIYGIIVEESIGRLFIAGIIPGILLTIFMAGSIYVRCRINPALGPRGPKTPIREKLVSLKDAIGVLVLFLFVIGGIYSGIFTPTEAGAMGAFGALIIGLIMRRISFKKFSKAVLGAIGLGSMIFFIFIYATALTQFLATTQLPNVLAQYIAGLETSRFLTLGLILFSYLILGCVMNAIPVVILTLPIIFPTVMALGFDPIWFGVLLVMMVEIGQITPPIGMSVFGMASVVPDVPMYTIFRGVFPFWMIMLGTVILVMIFPQLALYLPNIMMGN